MLVRITLSSGLIGDGGVVAIGFVTLVEVAFAFTLGGAFGLDAAARTFGELAFDLLDRFGLGRVLHDSDLARQAVERRFIQLAFRVGLLGLRLRAIEIA